VEGLMEKCSDGKRAATVGNLKGTWEPRYVVMSRQGLWWYKTKEAYDGGGIAQGALLELSSAEVNVRIREPIQPRSALSCCPASCAALTLCV
jgi:hypothetical protein